MGLYARRIGQAKQFVAWEIALLYFAIRDVDAAIECGREPKHHARFHLLGDDSGVDHGTRIDGHHDAMHANLAVGDRGFDHLGHDTAKAFVQGHTACYSWRQRRSPTCLVGR